MVDGFSCILDFSKFSRGGPPDPPYKGNTSIKPSKSFFNNNSSHRQKKKKKKRAKQPSPIKTIYKKFIFRLYRNCKTEEGAGARSFCVMCNWAVWNFVCAIAEDKVCGSCIVSSWKLLMFLLCLWWPNSNFLCCVITQNGESSRDLLLSVTNRKALPPGGGGGGVGGGTAPQSLPLKH